MFNGSHRYVYRHFYDSYGILSPSYMYLYRSMDRIFSCLREEGKKEPGCNTPAGREAINQLEKIAKKYHRARGK